MGMGEGERMDYEELLRKYIRHVGNMEGVDFITSRLLEKDFNDEEIDTLLRLSMEADNEN